MLSTFERAHVAPLICHHPYGAAASIRKWLGPRHRLLGQRGRTHPDRLRRAFEDVFAGGPERAVMVASDVPDLPAGMLCAAAAALDRSDAVLGPCSDGGYYLIGFRRDGFVPGAFRGVDWSTGRVFSQTAERIREAGRSVLSLPVWYDVDTASDLCALARRGASSVFRGSRTMEYLRLHPALTKGSLGGPTDA